MNNAFRAICALVSLALGCGQGADTPADPDALVDSIDVTSAPRTMPETPPVSAGRLAITTASRLDQYLVRTSWSATAGHCETTGLIQILVQTAEYGVGVLFPPPLDGSGPMELPLLPVNDSLLPDESARVVMQIYPEDRAYVLKAIEGILEIDSVAEHVSGRFSATLVEGTYRDTVLAAGVFASLPVNTIDDDHCRPLINRPDSLNADANEPMDRS